MVLKRIKTIANKNFKLLENFSYITVMQVFILLAPLITYPYLTRTLGMELYGIVITAQILSNYATLIVKFGFDSVSARHISINRDDKTKLSTIMSSILSMRFLLWIICLLLYLVVVICISTYREHFLLFLFSYGLTFNVLLFPQFFFQGVEDMKYITIINVAIQLIFVVLVFIVIKGPSDYLYVPLLHAAGYIIGGLAAIWMIVKNYGIKLTIPKLVTASFYLKDAFPLFATDIVSTIKDKLNYLLLGICTNMSNVVGYDIGAKLTSLAIQPLLIINTVIFPRMAKSRDDKQFVRIGVVVFILIAILIILLNLFLHSIVHFLAGVEIDLLPIRLYLLSPLFLAIGSYISSSLIVARGYNKYMFYSILVTTAVYITMLLTFFITHRLNTIMSFIGLTVISYLAEMVYRLYVAKRIIKKKI